MAAFAMTLVAMMMMTTADAAQKITKIVFLGHRHIMCDQGIYGTHVQLDQTNLISGSTDFFQNLKGWSEKRKIKKSPIFCVGFDLRVNPASIAIFQSLHSKSVSVC